MIVQLIQASVIITVALILYRSLLAKETHYQLNRWILLGCMCLAFTLPHLNLKVFVPTDIPLPFPQQEVVVQSPAPIPLAESEFLAEEVPDPSETEVLPSSYQSLEVKTTNTAVFSLAKIIKGLSFQDILLLIYLAGVLVMLTHFIIQVFSLIHDIQILPKRKHGKYILLELSQGTASYSFFNFIFINPKSLDNSTYEQVLSHERIHVDQKHSFDILLSQLLLISQWFNPFAWMYKKQVKQNLEYLTDDVMVKKGTDKTAYQFSLLRVSAPGLSSQLVLNYSQSLLKKRIQMMNTKKSSFLSMWKYAFLLPLLALSCLALVAEKAPLLPAVLPEQVQEQLAPVNLPETPLPTEIDEPEEGIVTNYAETVANTFPLSTEEISGTWEAKIKEEEVCLRIIRSISGDDWNWMSYDCYEPGDFSPKVTSSTTAFSLKRKAGALNFQGSFTEAKGEGKFQFEGSASYRHELAGKGIKNVSDDLLFRIFFVRDEDKFVDNLIALQKLGLDETSLQTLMTDGVKAGLVQGYQDAGLSVPDHLKFIRSRVKADLIKGYKDAGLDLEEHKGFVNSRVKPDLLIAYKDAGLDLVAHKSFINSRVKPDMLTEYKAAGFDLEEHKSYIQSRVKPSLLKEYKDAGFDLEEYRSFIQSRVKPDLLKAYKDAGFDHAEYTSYIQSRVKPELLKSYQAAGLDLKDNHSFIQSRVEPELLKAYKDAGFDLDKYTSFIQSRVKPEILKGYQEAGYDLDKYTSYIQSRVSPELLKSYEKAGFSPDKYRSFIQSRVKPELLTAYKDAGLDIEKNKSYIQSRVDPVLLTAYADAGFDLEKYHKYIHSRIKPEFLKAYEQAGLSLDDNKDFIQSRVSAEFLMSYKDSGFNPNDYKDFIHRRIKAEFLKEYQDAGLDIEDHRDFIMDRVDPEKVKKYRDAQKKKN